MTLQDEIFDAIVARIIKEGNPDDLAKFMLSGKECIAAVQQYFELLEADQKTELILEGNEWSLGFKKSYANDKYAGLALFKLVAPSIIPFVQKLHIINTHLEDYSFLNDIKHLHNLSLIFAEEEHTKILSALSSLQLVYYLDLDLKGINLQLLSSLSFSFYELITTNFVFEVDPKCDKVFQTTTLVHLNGNRELMNDFVFPGQNYQNYFDIFPNVNDFEFNFYIKVVDDISALLEVSTTNYTDEVEVLNPNTVTIIYRFFDYSGYPDSKVLRMLQDDENWHTNRSPYKAALTCNFPVNVLCSFPLAIAEVGNRLAEQSLRRIPEDSNGAPEDYYQLTLQNEWEHKAEFEVLKTISIESLLKVYGEIAGLNHERLRFHRCLISDGTVADKFQDGDTLMIIVG